MCGRSALLVLSHFLQRLFPHDVAQRLHDGRERGLVAAVGQVQLVFQRHPRRNIGFVVLDNSLDVIECLVNFRLLRLAGGHLVVEGTHLGVERCGQ